MNPDVCTTREAADQLGVSLRTVQLWVESGVLVAWKTVGGHRRISKESVDRLIAQRSQGPSGAPPRRDPCVLVAEDDPDLLKLYRLNIETWEPPVRLILASNGYEALIRIGDHSPDVLITDLRMPGIDGFRMLRALETDPAGRSLRVIVVSGLDDADIRASGGLPAGTTLMRKPVDFERLRDIVFSPLQDPERTS